LLSVLYYHGFFLYSSTIFVQNCSFTVASFHAFAASCAVLM